MDAATKFTPGPPYRDEAKVDCSRFNKGCDVMSKWMTPVVALVLAMSAGPALADIIDGDWCFMKDGRRFSIRGPEIVTPGGKKMQGNYSRHSFTYVVPAPEPGAGETVSMSLLNEETVGVRVGAEGAEETWRRCSPSTSTLRRLPVG